HEASVSLTDNNGRGATGRLIVHVAREGPVGGAAGYIREAGTQVQQRSEILAFDPRGRAAGAVRVAVVDATVTADDDAGTGLTDNKGGIAAGRLVVGVAGERPVGGAAGHIREAGTQVEQTAQVLALDTRG